LAGAYKSCNVFETVDDEAKVTINGLYTRTVLLGLSIAANVYDLE